MSAMDTDDFVVDSSGNTDAGAASPSAPVAVSGDASPDSVTPHEQAPADADLTTHETPESSEPERTPDGKFAKKGSIQERIDRATYEKHEAIRKAAALEARLAELERAQQSPAPPEPTAAPTSPADRPKIDDFNSYEEWVEAVADWKADKKLAAFQQQQHESVARQQHAETMQAHTARVQAFAAKTPDYFEVIGRAADLPLSAALQDVLVTSDRGPELAYFLATHQDEALQLVQETASLPATAAPLVRRLLESKLSPTASSGPVVGGSHRSVPAPIKPVGAAPVVTDTPLDELDVDAFVARENARERAERKSRLGVRS